MSFPPTFDHDRALALYAEGLYPRAIAKVLRARLRAVDRLLRRRKVPRRRAPLDLTTQRFGRLVVVERLGANPYGEVTWRCRCDCGAECVKRGLDLRRKVRPSQSCGRTCPLRARAA